MKRKLQSVFLMASIAMSFNQIKAQEYQAIPIQSGFNADVIANGVGTALSSTNNDVDGVSYAFVSRDFQLTSTGTALTYGLPINRIINTAVASTNGLSYQLADYSGNNSLRLTSTTTSGTLTFATPTPAINLYMLATGGSGATTVDAVVNFSDTTTQAFTGISISDWYSGSNYAIQGIGRINLNNNNLESGNGTNPRLYQIPLAISTANQSKNITSVTITKMGTGGLPNIFAFSADVYNSCQPPTNITSVTTPTSATLSWVAPSSAPSSGYEYYYSTSPTAPTATTPPTGSVAAGVTSALLNSLTTGQTYYFWVRSNCGSAKGFWKMKEFIPGQVSATFTSNDISTAFASNEPTVSSTSSCSGTLSLTIPSGYKIASTKVNYTMTAQAGAYMSEQKSLLICTTNNSTESTISSASGSSGGTFTYERTGLNLANDLVGTVDFQLHAWRTWGNEGLGCDASYNKVNNGTWTVTVTLAPLNLSINEAKAEKKTLISPNPFSQAINIKNSEKVKQVVVTDVSGRNIKSINNPSSSIYLGDLKSGLYILNMTMTDGTVENVKIIKK
ncbi:MAG: T9SS type A sorting domain-containing protein [Chryseobacterium sp.]|uniref:T9SS type A sorting domain-containing protein n=1 Tax=Chryseobacterium sp. TaxID=1871047 RepID=UPI001B1CDDAE|nr:T9SS type A sorting domain-containing protein [Chryseobacterium sp.]MBO6186704.1 T9SS type A sorting domain-containing protein [Chryseobacterium sp.]